MLQLHVIYLDLAVMQRHAALNYYHRCCCYDGVLEYCGVVHIKQLLCYSEYVYFIAGRCEADTSV